MSMIAAMAAGAGSTVLQTYIEDVFSTWLYTGNGSTQTITNGIDLAGKGGMVWTKGRSPTALHHVLNDTVRGAGSGFSLSSNQTIAQGDTSLGWVSSFSSTGYVISGSGSTDANRTSENDVSWSFAKAAKFFHVSSQVKAAGVSKTVDLSALGTVGMVKVKRTDSTGSWYVWHRSCTAGKLLIGETTAAEATLGQITVSGTTLTLVDGVIADGTYHVEAYAHDTSATGLIQCGSFTTDGSGNASVTLGWEPQYLQVKIINGVDSWVVTDTMRGWSQASTDRRLFPNLSNAESTDSECGYPTATGLVAMGLTASKTYIYLAIRRGPMKLPTVGTQVFFGSLAGTGDGTYVNAGFPVDWVINTQLANAAQDRYVNDRLRGFNAEVGIRTNSTVAESANVGTYFGGSTSSGNNYYAVSGYGAKNWSLALRRYPGVFDIVCYTGTGSATTVAHNLGVAPELMLIKIRNSAESWAVYYEPTKRIWLDLTNAAAVAGSTYWNNTAPTSSQFTVVSDNEVNQNTYTYVANLFATLAGISKVGSYTGNGSNLTLNMGFAAGARFFMCKRTDSAGNWFLWDYVQGIIAGNDPYITINAQGAEVTTDDSVDPDNSGIIVNEVAATHINVNAATYIYLAFA